MQRTHKSTLKSNLAKNQHMTTQECLQTVHNN